MQNASNVARILIKAMAVVPAQSAGAQIHRARRRMSTARFCRVVRCRFVQKSSGRSLPVSLTPPFNLQRWIDEHRHLLKPPVGNKCIVDGDFIIMIVGGPNSRTDYHWDEGPEFFYQLEGEMVLRAQDDGQRRDLPIRAGEIFYLPPRTPHSPQRMPDSIGLVIERRRLPHEKDGLLWFCEKCNHKLYEEYFVLGSIEEDFPPVFARYYGSLEARTCKHCGHVDQPPAK